MMTNPPDGYAGDDFLEQILSPPPFTGFAGADYGNSSETASLNHSVSHLSSVDASVSGLHHHTLFPLGLSLDNGHEAAFQGQLMPSTAVTVPHAPGIRPRVRARRGQATDPHSIAERLRRERISERIKALQELVPSCNKTDRATMLDEILDYVKFLRLQVKVLSMRRLGGADAVAQLVTDIPLQSMEGETSEIGSNQNVWEKWSNEETENEVAKLMEEDVGAAMQFLQSKSLCIMPISLAALIYPTNQSDDSILVKPEPPAHS